MCQRRPVPRAALCILTVAAWLLKLHQHFAGGELTRIPYGGNFAAGGGGGGEAAADTRRALATNAGLRRVRTPQLRAQLAAEGARQAFARARGAVARVRDPCPGSSMWPRLLFCSLCSSADRTPAMHTYSGD
jgi:hypothetical protein